MAKLTQEQKDEIVNRWRCGETQNSLAKRFSRECSIATINRLCKGIEQNNKISPLATYRTRQSLNEKNSGFIYVIYFLDASNIPYYKIGVANDIKSRFKQHQSSNPFPLDIALSYYSSESFKEEKILHGMFEEKRIGGEWFSLSTDDLKLIASRSLRIK